MTSPNKVEQQQNAMYGSEYDVVIKKDPINPKNQPNTDKLVKTENKILIAERPLGPPNINNVLPVEGVKKEDNKNDSFYGKTVGYLKNGWGFVKDNWKFWQWGQPKLSAEEEQKQLNELRKNGNSDDIYDYYNKNYAFFKKPKTQLEQEIDNKVTDGLYDTYYNVSAGGGFWF